jgi:hypothetical protein
MDNIVVNNRRNRIKNIHLPKPTESLCHSGGEHTNVIDWAKEGLTGLASIAIAVVSSRDRVHAVLLRFSHKLLWET